MPLIQSLAPRLSQEEAVKLLRPGVLGRTLGIGPLRQLASVFVPVHLFRVGVESRSARNAQLLASDAVAGTLDLLGFDHLPSADEITAVESQNCLPSLLDVDRGRELVTERVRRMTYQGGFFRLRGLEIRCELIPVSFYMPYWLGFFGTGERASLRALNAVRGRVEGAKARSLFSDWIVRQNQSAGDVERTLTN
jgi:hypothetical protein